LQQPENQGDQKTANEAGPKNKQGRGQGKPKANRARKRCCMNNLKLINTLITHLKENRVLMKRARNLIKMENGISNAHPDVHC